MTHVYLQRAGRPAARRREKDRRHHFRPIFYQKGDEDKHLAFGWAYVSQDEEGQQTEDWSGDQLEPAELEQAAYGFVELYREGGEMHERGGCAVLVESMVFTTEKQQALGIPDGTLPVGWWIGFKVTDEDVWAKVKDGTYPMFSIEGSAIREEIPEEPEA